MEESLSALKRLELLTGLIKYGIICIGDSQVVIAAHRGQGKIQTLRVNSHSEMPSGAELLLKER
jgi:hypothetical protein